MDQVNKVALSGIITNAHPFWAFPHYAALISDKMSIIHTMAILSENISTSQNSASLRADKVVWAFVFAWIKCTTCIVYKNADQSPALQKLVGGVAATLDKTLAKELSNGVDLAPVLANQQLKFDAMNTDDDHRINAGYNINGANLINDNVTITRIRQDLTGLLPQALGAAIPNNLGELLRIIYISQSLPFIVQRAGQNNSAMYIKADEIIKALNENYGLSQYIIDVMSDFSHVDIQNNADMEQYRDLFNFLTDIIAFRASSDRLTKLVEIKNAINNFDANNDPALIVNRVASYNRRFGNAITAATADDLKRIFEEASRVGIRHGQLARYITNINGMSRGSRRREINGLIYLALRASGHANENEQPQNYFRSEGRNRVGVLLYNNQNVEGAQLPNNLGDAVADPDPVLNRDNIATNFAIYMFRYITKETINTYNRDHPDHPRQIPQYANDDFDDYNDTVNRFRAHVDRSAQATGKYDTYYRWISAGEAAHSRTETSYLDPNFAANLAAVDIGRVVADIERLITQVGNAVPGDINRIDTYINNYISIRKRPIDFSQLYNSGHPLLKTRKLQGNANVAIFNHDVIVEGRSTASNDYTRNELTIDICRKYYALFYEYYSIIENISKANDVIKSEDIANTITKIKAKFSNDIFSTSSFPTTDSLLNIPNIKCYFPYAANFDENNSLTNGPICTIFGKIILLSESGSANIFKKMLIKPITTSSTIREIYRKDGIGKTDDKLTNMGILGDMPQPQQQQAAQQQQAPQVQVPALIIPTQFNLTQDLQFPAALAMPDTIEHCKAVANAINVEALTPIKNKIILLTNTGRLAHAQALSMIILAKSNKRDDVIDGVDDADLPQDDYSMMIALLIQRLVKCIIHVGGNAHNADKYLGMLLSVYMSYLNGVALYSSAITVYLYAIMCSIYVDPTLNVQNANPANDAVVINVLDALTDRNTISLLKRGMPKPSYYQIRIAINTILKNIIMCLSKENSDQTGYIAIKQTNVFSKMLTELDDNVLSRYLANIQDIENDFDYIENLAFAGGSMTGGSISVNKIYEFARRLSAHPSLKAVYKATPTSTSSPNIPYATDVLFSNEQNPLNLIRRNARYYYPLNNDSQDVFNIELPNSSMTLFAASEFAPEIREVYLGRDFGSRLDPALVNNNVIKSHFYIPTKDMYIATIHNLAEQEVKVDDIVITLTHNVEYLKNLIANVNANDRMSYTNALNIENMSLSTFIQMFIPEMIRGVTSEINPKDAFQSIINSNIMTTPSTSGFDLGIIGGLLGGASEANNFINIGKITGLNIVEKMISAYTIGEANKNVIESILDIRTNLFGKVEDPVQTLYSLVMRYFRKKNIQLSSIYNHIVFPNIIYGSALFRYGIEQISKVMDDLMTHVSASGQTSLDVKRFDAIRQYLGKIVANKSYNNQYVIGVSDNRDSRANRFIGEYTDPTDMHSSLSLVNDQLKVFLKFIEEDSKNMLFCSNLPSIIQQFDMISTIITMVFLIVKETGVYDPTQKRTKSLVDENKGDPFILSQ